MVFYLLCFDVCVDYGDLCDGYVFWEIGFEIYYDNDKLFRIFSF